MKKFHQLMVAEVRRETPDAVSILFEVPSDLEDSFRYVQGQHITLKTEIAGEELRRCYSVCTGVQENELRIAVKQIEGGRFSGFCNRQLKAGDLLEVLPPAGHFFTELDKSARKNYVAFSGGSGITPILSLIKTTLFEEPDSSFTLVYGNRDQDSIIFGEALARLKNKYLNRFRLFHVLQNGASEVALYNGLLTEEKCTEFLSGLVDAKKIDAFFICGPAPMMDGVEKSLLKAGVKADAIHIERFISGPEDTPPADKARLAPTADPTTRNARISVILDGEKTSFDFTSDDLSILDAALDAGTDVPYACKGAVCCTCRARVLEGAVDMALNYGLEKEELEAGYVLTCQSTPTTDEVVLSFDD